MRALGLLLVFVCACTEPSDGMTRDSGDEDGGTVGSVRSALTREVYSVINSDGGELLTAVPTGGTPGPANEIMRMLRKAVRGLAMSRHPWDGRPRAFNGAWTWSCTASPTSASCYSGAFNGHLFVRNCWSFTAQPSRLFCEFGSDAGVEGMTVFNLFAPDVVNYSFANALHGAGLLNAQAHTFEYVE